MKTFNYRSIGVKVNANAASNDNRITAFNFRDTFGTMFLTEYVQQNPIMRLAVKHANEEALELIAKAAIDAAYKELHAQKRRRKIRRYVPKRIRRIS